MVLLSGYWRIHVIEVDIDYDLSMAKQVQNDPYYLVQWFDEDLISNRQLDSQGQDYINRSNFVHKHSPVRPSALQWIVNKIVQSEQAYKGVHELVANDLGHYLNLIGSSDLSFHQIFWLGDLLIRLVALSRILLHQHSLFLRNGQFLLHYQTEI